MTKRNCMVKTEGPPLSLERRHAASAIETTELKVST